ncbi:MAG: hypothetical protein ACXWJB_10735, partial [Limisphaerales bacterium]
MSFSQRQAAAAARAEQENALRKQKDRTVKELLGFAWSTGGLKNAYEGEWIGSVGFLDFEHAEKFLCIADRFDKPFARANSSHRIDRRSAIYHEWHQEVGRILSPAEFEESELRGILIIYQRRYQTLINAGLSGSELRQLMIYRREL